MMQVVLGESYMFDLYCTNITQSRQAYSALRSLPLPL